MFIKALKRSVRMLIENIPLGIGKRLMVFYRLLIGKKKKIYFEKKEAKRVLDLTKNKQLKEILVVYDYLCSPPTYGDFLCTVMLARYFLTIGIKTNFFIIEGEYRDDWKNFSDEGKIHRCDEHLKFAEILLDNKLCSVKKYNWKDFRASVNEHKDIVFKKNVLTRTEVYAHSLNTLNHLCRNSQEIFLKHFLLKEEDFLNNIQYKKIDSPYVTYHCRRSEKTTSLFRNTQDQEFIQILSALTNLYPAHKVLILSDFVGYEYFKKLSKLHKLECLFSKDYSDSFFGDCGLLLGGDLHFTLRGGGIDMVSIFSQGPYEQFASPINDYMLENGKATSWSSDNQFYTDIKGKPGIFFPSAKVKLG